VLREPAPRLAVRRCDGFLVLLMPRAYLPELAAPGVHRPHLTLFDHNTHRHDRRAPGPVQFRSAMPHVRVGMTTLVLPKASRSSKTRRLCRRRFRHNSNGSNPIHHVRAVVATRTHQVKASGLTFLSAEEDNAAGRGACRCVVRCEVQQKPCQYSDISPAFGPLGLERKSQRTRLTLYRATFGPSAGRVGNDPAPAHTRWKISTSPESLPTQKDNDCGNGQRYYFI
jgi:hypothetical protein